MPTSVPSDNSYIAAKQQPQEPDLTVVAGKKHKKGKTAAETAAEQNKAAGEKEKTVTLPAGAEAAMKDYAGVLAMFFQVLQNQSNVQSNILALNATQSQIVGSSITTLNAVLKDPLYTYQAIHSAQTTSQKSDADKDESTPGSKYYWDWEIHNAISSETTHDQQLPGLQGVVSTQINQFSNQQTQINSVTGMAVQGISNITSMLGSIFTMLQTPLNKMSHSS